MSDLRKEKSVAYISSVQFNPKTLQPVSQPLLSANDQVSALMFSDRNSTRTATVSANGEFSLPPDKVKLTIIVRSVKNTIDEAKTSTGRRADYIQQTLRNHGLKETDVNITKTYNRLDTMFEVLVEVVATFSDFAKYQQMHNLFVEKLDGNVRILQPQLFHTSLRLENLKRQASIQAIRNAKHIALDLAKTVGLSLGKPLNIIEEGTREIEGVQSADRQPDASLPKTFQELVNDKTVTVVVGISVTFELKVKSKFRKDNI